MSDPITAASPDELRRIALHHIRAAERLLPRFNSLADVAAHVTAARLAMERAQRSEDDTKEVPTP